MISQSYPAPVIKTYTEVLPAEPGTEAAETAPIPSMYETDIKKVEEPSIFIPYAGQLNLAFFYPDGADRSNPLDSFAGSAFKTLTVKDAEWLSEIYDLSDLKPEELAKRLGKPVSSIMGLFNPKDENQDIKNQDTWRINSWKKINLSFYDENGKTIVAYSNVKEILSMASVYTYYTGMMDHEAFLQYAESLWEKSHSFEYSMSEIYYCDGCRDKDEDEMEGIETETETSSVPESVTESAALSVEETSAANTESLPPETTEPESGSEVGPGVATEAPSLASPPDAVMTESEMEAADSTEMNEPTEPEPEIPKCPGHLNLNIRVTITGLNGLFLKDSSGNNQESVSVGGWQGWDRYKRYYAQKLADQDWMEYYGLSASSVCVRNPLTASEIESYMALLPSDTSKVRQEIIKFALSSVGKVPYYWGGKPSSENYRGNAFGSLLVPDEKGRSMRGLDCSGWVNWVYWSVTGTRLPYEGTDGLSRYGTAIRRSELKPGDIIVRRGESAHVVMFMNWEADGRMQVIHETSGGINNVTISKMNADWPYYRRLVE